MPVARQEVDFASHRAKYQMQSSRNIDSMYTLCMEPATVLVAHCNSSPSCFDAICIACPLEKRIHSVLPSWLQKYANHDLIKYLESIGAEFGACQNAYTSADDTVYEFMVPTDDEDLEILDRSFDVFAEFATKIRYVSYALTTRQQLTIARRAQPDLTCLSLAAALIDISSQQSQLDTFFLPHSSSLCWQAA